MAKIFDKHVTKISVSVHMPFSIDLEALGGAGFEWFVEHDANAIAFLGAEPAPARPSLVGASVIKRHTFRALKQGRHYLKLVHKRALGSIVIEHATIEVEVD